QVVVAVHDQAAQAVALAVDHAPGVAGVVQAQHLATQVHGLGDPAREPGGVDRHVRIGLEDAQGDARVAVVEAASDPGPIHAHDVDDAAGLDPLGRLLDQALEDPRVAGAPGVAQADGGEGVGHGCQFTWAACAPPPPPPPAGGGAPPGAPPPLAAPPAPGR